MLIMSYLIGWIFIGLAASLGASLWPFRRGLLGIAMNIGAGIAGAVGLAHVGMALGLPQRDPLTMVFAGGGAFVMLAIAHGIWQAGRKGNRDAPEMLSRP
jgi:uncharacterized membrane protein YeaQ/YmgE (transglycosylase-associated protein family)